MKNIVISALIFASLSMPALAYDSYHSVSGPNISGESHSSDVDGRLHTHRSVYKRDRNGCTTHVDQQTNGAGGDVVHRHTVC